MARPRSSPTEKTCKVCGNVFPTPTPNDAKRTICSDECRSVELRTRHLGKRRPGQGGRPRLHPLTRDCVVCGELFPIPTDQARKQTCSRPCTSQLYSITKGGLAKATCDACGGEYHVKRWYLRNGRRFCGELCRRQWLATQGKTGAANPYWRGGRSGYYGPTWQAARRGAWARDGYRCTVCNRHADELGERPIVHHIVPFKHFGLDRHAEANQQDNLQSLCRSCHMRMEWALHRRTTGRPTWPPSGDSSPA